MSRRHHRNVFFIASTGKICGEVNRPATPSERERAFRFSQIVRGKSSTPSDALLAALAEIMTHAAPDIDSHIPAGFTYLGQFVDHDLTRDRTDVPFGTPVADPSQLTQARSPALDLDSVYGNGPSVDPAFYASDKIRLKIGRTQESGPPPIANLSLDGFDLPRKGANAANPDEVRMAQIPDPRNDENLAIAQTHLAFIRFHNRVCDRLADLSIPSSMLFERAREMVVKHYQWMLVTDFLPRIVDPAIVDDVFTKGRRIFEVVADGFPTMPIEFSVAAYRLGHSMIREKYDWNAVFGVNGSIGDFGTLENLFRFSGGSGNLSPFTSNTESPSDVNNPSDGDFERLPTNWIADWTRLYDFVADGTPKLAPETTLNFARPLDIRLTDPLKKLPLGAFGARGGQGTVPPLQMNLAFRNLVRGRMVELASGQEVAAYIAAQIPGTPILSKEQIIGSDLEALTAAQKEELANATPLWFYILREASLNTSDKPGTGKLGAVGGRIVAEVFHRAIEGSQISLIRDPYFSPSLGVQPGVFRMTDLLQVAYDASRGELRPLSPNAPHP
jgi:Animal haem peroxidase